MGLNANTSFYDSMTASPPRTDPESGKRRLGQEVLHAGGWSAIADVACKSEIPLTANRVSFANMFTSNMSLSESGRLRW